MRALFIETRPDGNYAMWVSDLSTDVSERVKQMKDHVGGWLEAVTLNGGVMYVNEEGKLRGLPHNEVATHVATVHRGIAWGADPIVGNAVIVGPTDDMGDDTDLPDALKDEFYAIVEDHA